MASTAVLLLQLLLLPLASESQLLGGMATYTYRGQNPDGTYRVDLRSRQTFKVCEYLYWGCYGSNCLNGYKVSRGVIDRHTNISRYYGDACETEAVLAMNVRSDKPFRMRAAKCCRVGTDNSLWHWRLLTEVDLGKRSDTRKPNRSPDIGILPFLRVPQNCPRTYKLTSFDPDGDKVRCRYGNVWWIECHYCRLPPGFLLDQGSCTLHYNYTQANIYAFVLELMVEDFPQGYINLQYGDGSRSYRAPMTVRRGKRWANAFPYPTGSQTTSPYTTGAPTAAPYSTTGLYTTGAPTAAPYSTAAPTTAPYTTTTTAPYTTKTTAPYTTTTTAPYTTTTTAPYTIGAPTTAPYTTAAQTTAPYTTGAPTTAPYTTAAPTTAPYTTTTTAPYTTAAPTTAPYTTTAPTTAPYTTTTTAPYTTTATTTTAPTTPSWTRAPLSKLPMQFSFLVDPPAPSCQEGAFLPKFLPPTPSNGARFLAEVNKELEIRVKAQATKARINNIIVSGPANIRKHQNTHEEFVLRWTPLPDDHGLHFVICFAVEAVKSSAVYQSEMRCVVVEARSEIVKSHVICSESSMTVSVEKASFPRLHEDHMRLNDPSNTACSLQRHSNSTHIIAIIPLNACGTQIEEDEENLIFKNEITTVDNPSDLITRKHLMEVQFYCQYPKRGNASLSFVAHRRNITVWERGFGTFTYQFEFYPNIQFRTRMDPAAYPLEYDIGNRIYLKIEATSSVNNTELFVESCRAAPYDNPNYQPTYSIFENGCKMDPTVQIHSPANQKEFKFSMEAFKFIGMNNQVYISCSVMMCEAGNPNTRCSKGCLNSTSSSSPRSKREAVIQSASHFVSQGPLRLRRSAERVGATATNLNLNLVFIAGCVLAAVGMVCGVVMYRANVSKVKYQPLPTFDS